MLVQIKKTFVPTGGGFPLYAGRVVDLPADVVETLPDDCYDEVEVRDGRIAEKQTTPAADKQFVGGKKKNHKGTKGAKD